ncbi:CU044_5270 family protein [Streptomyces sp. NPDC000594]|uniref:CU044_5270 family protein n=1 Tax=Streptomyces sp. NPDC000594 TaxID=3154261 RepID=UPI00332320B7
MNITPGYRSSPRPERDADPAGEPPLPPPPVPALRPERERLLKEAVLRGATDPAPRAARTRRVPRPGRRAPRLLLPAMACALAFGALAVPSADGPVTGTGREGGWAAGPVPGGGARGLLDRIALAAAGREPSVVRAGQFVYIESQVAHSVRDAAGGPVTVPPARTRRVWLSADGSRPGLLREEGLPDQRLERSPSRYGGQSPTGARRPLPGARGATLNDPTHALVAALPTDPDALLRLIRHGTRGRGQDPDQQAFATIGDLLAESWAPPEVSAALYRTAARIPGVTVVERATDAAGREGIAVARTAHGEQRQWIFDRSDYAFLGERTVRTRTGAAGTAGAVTGSSAVLTRAAVDRAGEIPAAARGRAAGPRR